MKKGTLLITGASGLLGSNLCLHFRKSWRVIGLYRLHPLTMVGVETYGGDLMELETISSDFDFPDPDVVIHTAAFAQVDWCEENPQQAQLLHVASTRFLRHLWPRAYFVYISTDSIYGQGEGPHDEEEGPTPLTVYARTKLEGEFAVSEISDLSVILRTCIYGLNYQFKHSLGEWMWERLSTGEGFDGFTDISFSPILVNDLAEVIEAVIERKLTGNYNAGSVSGCPKFEFGRMLAMEGRFDPELVRPVQGRTARFAAPRPLAPVMDARKVEQALDRRMPSVGDGIMKFVSLINDGYQGLLRGNGV